MTFRLEEICNSINSQSRVEEFKPTKKNDSQLTELRNLFVSSFYEYYKTIGSQLNLPEGKTLQHWLEETFDEEADKLLSGKRRCFLIFTQSFSSIIAGFLTTRERENDLNEVYISQCAINPTYKRQGYGSHLMKDLPNFFPSATLYTGVCRRLNQSALNFYEKYGAKRIDDDQIATKYGYNPKDYLGFQFIVNQLQIQTE
jgi:ribosomal protein S18 acetylase RimI-like enzyme